jgi:hypothetical protein
VADDPHAEAGDDPHAEAGDDPHAEAGDDPRPVVWTLATIAAAEDLRAIETFAEDYKGLDLDNTPGILPGGGMYVPEDPTPAQTAYLTRRYALNLRDRYHQTLRDGLTTLPRIIPFRPGDLIP